MHQTNFQMENSRNIRGVPSWFWVCDSLRSFSSRCRYERHIDGRMIEIKCSIPRGNINYPMVCTLVTESRVCFFKSMNEDCSKKIQNKFDQAISSCHGRLMLMKFLMCGLSSGSRLSLATLYGHDGTHWAYNGSFPQLKHEEATAIMNVLKGGRLQGLHL
jgi:hypothetical protein